MGWQVPDEIAARSAEVDDREFLTELFTLRGIARSTRRRVGSPQAAHHPVDLLRFSPGSIQGWPAWSDRSKARSRLAVVSGTWRENIQVVLESHRAGGLVRRLWARKT